jgi:hypothetical protein
MVSLPTRGTASSATKRTGAAFRRATAYHRNQTLLLAIVEYLRCAGPLFFIQRPLQTALLITAADISDGLRGQRNHAGNARRSDAFGQLQKG